MNFTETPICKSRANCFHCRNNEQFRQQMEQQYSSWECPEGIAIGAKLEDLPQKSQEAHKQMKEMEEQRQNQIKEIAIALDELQTICPQEGKRLIDKIRGYLNPQSKTPQKCKYGGGEIGEVDEKCCGGQINKKMAYECGKHSLTTEKKCMGCGDFESE